MLSLKVPDTQHRLDDAASELLIAQFLREELALEAQYQQAETMQFEEALGNSLGVDGDFPPSDAVDSDYALALRLSLNEVHKSGDAQVAQKMQHVSERESTASLQAAQAAAAEEVMFYFYHKIFDQLILCLNRERSRWTLNSRGNFKPSTIRGN